MPELRAGDLRLVPAPLRPDASTPRREAVVTIGSKEGIAHLLLALVGPGDCVLSPDPCYPDPPLRRHHRRRRAGAGGDRPRTAITSREIETALARAPRPPKGLIVNFPHNPTTATVDLGFYEKVVRWPSARSCGSSPIWRTPICASTTAPAPSIFQVPGARDVAVEFFTVSKSYSMPGWRVGFCVGNPTWSAASTTIKGYLDYGIFAPAQLAAATALANCDADVAENRERLPAPRRRCCARRWPTAGWPVPMPEASMFVWAPLPPALPRSWARSPSRPTLLEKARVAVSPGVGFGPGGEGFVRFSLVEKDDRRSRPAPPSAIFWRLSRGR